MPTRGRALGGRGAGVCRRALGGGLDRAGRGERSLCGRGIPVLRPPRLLGHGSLGKTAVDRPRASGPAGGGSGRGQGSGGAVPALRPAVLCCAA